TLPVALRSGTVIVVPVDGLHYRPERGLTAPPRHLERFHPPGVGGGSRTARRLRRIRRPPRRRRVGPVSAAGAAGHRTRPRRTRRSPTSAGDTLAPRRRRGS